MFVFILVLVKFQKNTFFFFFCGPSTVLYFYIVFYFILFLFYLCSVLNMKMNLSMMFGDRLALSHPREMYRTISVFKYFPKKSMYFYLNLKKKEKKRKDIQNIPGLSWSTIFKVIHFSRIVNVRQFHMHIYKRNCHINVNV